MPASVAHMLIAHKGLKKLQGGKDKGLAEFAAMLDGGSRRENYQAYMNLGSLGPDLYYFTDLAKGVKDILWDGYVQAKGVTPWAYHLHSSRPNEFPLRLIEIMFSDVVRQRGRVKLEVDDMRKLAYIAGHLSHIAADQIIHPLVNKIAGPYYRDGKNRETHREAEVYQDYFLYEEVYRLEKKSGPTYEFFEQDFRGWVDCVRGATLENTRDWFRYFLQRGFIETYGAAPTEGEIEDAVDGVLLSLRASRSVGPYKKANKEYKRKGRNGANFQKYVRRAKYVDHYKKGVELTAVYVSALYEAYRLLKGGKDFRDKRKWFVEVVSGADLGCPLETDILKKAKTALTKGK
jgi:hypothetical protein